MTKFEKLKIDKKNTTFPLISVIVPNYNHGKFLEERLESIINQTYKNFEIIVLDDCSNDNSLEVINKYKNHISNLVVNSKNSGSPFLQWKKGINLAKGKWIWIAESDDYCETTLLETLIKNTIKYPDCVLSYCKTLRVNANGKAINIPQYKELNKSFVSKKFIKKRLLATCDILNAGCAIFKKSAAEKIPEDFTKYNCVGDKRFWTEIAMQGHVAVSPKCLNYFRHHTTNTSKDQEKFISYVEEDKKTFDFIIKKKIIKNKGYLNFCAKASYNKFIDRESKLSNKVNLELHKTWEQTKLMKLIPWFWGDLHAQGPLRYFMTLVRYSLFVIRNR